MSIRLYRPTLSIRATVDQQARLVLPEEDVKTLPEGLGNHYRQVTVLVPSSPGLFLGIDQPVQEKFAQEGIGPNRTWTMPVIPGGQVIPFRLMDHQYITALAESGTVFLTLICEYLEDF